MADPYTVVAELVGPALNELAGRAVDPVVRPSTKADAQVNGALPVAKQLGRDPRQVAEQVVAACAEALAPVAEAEVAGPGFINITFTGAFLSEALAAMAGEDLGVWPADPLERVVIDYSAPNVAKEMHIGHLRSTVIGDALVRLLTSVGHSVIKENHLGDWGTPFGMLIEHLSDLGHTGAAQITIGDLDEFYRASRREFDSDEGFRDRSRDRVVRLQSGDPETVVLWRQLVDESTRYFNRIYQQLGVLLTDDDLRGESAYNDLLPGVIERLSHAGLLEQSDGADVVFPTGFTNRDGDPLPLIVQKGHGGFNYATSDLACIIDRVERLKATLLLYVVGAPQAQHFDMVFRVAGMAGWLEPPVRAVHVAFGNVLGADHKMFKTRSGDTIKLATLLDEAVRRGQDLVSGKSPGLSPEDQRAVGRDVGIGAIKYADLSNDRMKDYVFDWDRMLAFDGNSAPYLQYAHARARSVLRRAPSPVPAPDRFVLDEPAERALALRLLGYGGAIWSAIDRLAPHRLCGYLFDLACDFTRFYEACPILTSPEAARPTRLALTGRTADVLRRGLSLLGIAAPDRM